MCHYECECLKCGRKAQIAFPSEPYPEIGEAFVQFRYRRMTPGEVIDYIADHDLRKATQVRK